MLGAARRSFAQLFCFFNEHLSDHVPAIRRATTSPDIRLQHHEVGLGEQVGLLGFTDDNRVDGTQTFVFAFDADIYREFG